MCACNEREDSRIVSSVEGDSRQCRDEDRLIINQTLGIVQQVERSFATQLFSFLLGASSPSF